MKKYLIIPTKIVTLILFLIRILFRNKPIQEIRFLPLICISIAMIDLFIECYI